MQQLIKDFLKLISEPDSFFFLFKENKIINLEENSLKIINILDEKSDNIFEEDILNIFRIFLEFKELKKDKFIENLFKCSNIYNELQNFHIYYKSKTDTQKRENEIEDIDEAPIEKMRESDNSSEDQDEELNIMNMAKDDESSIEKPKNSDDESSIEKSNDSDDNIRDSHSCIKRKIWIIYTKNIIFEEIYKLCTHVFFQIFDKNKIEAITDKNKFTEQKFFIFLDSLDINKKEIGFNNLKYMEKLLYDIKQKKIIKIFNDLSKKTEGLKFLLSISTRDCINMQEFAGEVFGGNNQQFLSLEDLRVIEKLVEIFERIKNYNIVNHNNIEKNIISYLSKELDKEENNLIRYLNNYKQYQQFFNENLSKNKYILQTIENILYKSEFILLNNENLFFSGYYFFDDVKKYINYDFLLELRDRAISNRYKKIDYNQKYKVALGKEEEKQIEIINYIIEYIHQINELIKLIKKINKKGLIYRYKNKEDITKNIIKEDIAKKSKKKIYFLLWIKPKIIFL